MVGCQMWKFGLSLSLSLLTLQGIECLAQERTDGSVVCDFSFNDTVCINTPVTITNLSQGASTYLWNFCPGTPMSFPSGIPSGQLQNQLNVPVSITLVQDGNTFYAFVTNSGNKTITRITWQNSLLNLPVFDVLAIPGILTTEITGIQVKNDNGNWYGFVASGSSLVRLDFGSSLANLAPASSVIASSPLMNTAKGLVVGFDGSDWVGFCTNFPAQTITRFAWGTSLASIPALTDFGNVGGLTRPMQPALIQDSSGWHMFVSNTTSISQLKFGNSLMNMPTGVNLGNLQWITDNRGASTHMQCGNPYVLVSNHDVVLNQIFLIHFKNGLNGSKNLIPLGSIGGLFETVGLSETLSVGDTIFCIGLNSYPSLSTLYFIPCSNNTMPPSTLFDPSPVTFTEAGTFTISLTVDLGLPTEQKVCKEIEVVEERVELGPDTSFCEGNTIVLDAGKGYRLYDWSTGDTTQTIVVDITGTFSVTVTDQFGCTAEDSIRIVIRNDTVQTVDTSICYGESYLAGGALQTTTGIYYDTLTASNGCERIIITNLAVAQEITVDLGPDTCMVRDTAVRLQAVTSGAASYTWQDGSHDSIYIVTSPGEYWVTAEVGACTASDTISITECPPIIYFHVPNAFSPNGDGLNDVFRPAANEIVEFSMVIYNRWGQQVFETRDLSEGWDGTFNGSYCEPGVYIYILTYKDSINSGSVKKMHGNVTLLR